MVIVVVVVVVATIVVVSIVVMPIGKTWWWTAILGELQTDFRSRVLGRRSIAQTPSQLA